MDEFDEYVSEQGSLGVPEVNNSLETTFTFSTFLKESQMKIVEFFQSRENIMQFTAIILLVIYITFASKNSTPSYFRSNIWKVSCFLIVIFISTKYPSVALGLSFCLLLSILYSELSDLSQQIYKPNEQNRNQENDLYESFQSKNTEQKSKPKLMSKKIKYKKTPYKVHFEDVLVEKMSNTTEEEQNNQIKKDYNYNHNRQDQQEQEENEQEEQQYKNHDEENAILPTLQVKPKQNCHLIENKKQRENCFLRQRMHENQNKKTNTDKNSNINNFKNNSSLNSTTTTSNDVLSWTDSNFANSNSSDYAELMSL